MPKDEAEEQEEKITPEATPEITPELTPEITVFKEPEENKEIPKQQFDMQNWNPKTSIGKKVKSGEITSINEILDHGHKILEPEIIDALVSNLESDLLLVGQSKGKFGGGARRVFRQTQKKTREGNKPRFSAFAVVGNHNGLVGIGYGKSKETVPAREKAIRNAKLNLFKIRRGSGSWESDTTEAISIPFEVHGKCGSIKLTLIPAPKGTGLCAESEIAKIFALAGVKNIWTRTRGQTNTRPNLIKACDRALHKLVATKVSHDKLRELHIVEGTQ